MRHDEPAATFDVDDVVFTTDDDYAREWWHNWPGVVRTSLRSGREFLVEFMGFGKPETRQAVIPVGSLQHLEDPVVGARVNRILHTQAVPEDGKKRGAQPLLPKVQPKAPVDLPEDPDVDDDDILN